MKENNIQAAEIISTIELNPTGPLETIKVEDVTKKPLEQLDSA